MSKQLMIKLNTSSPNTTNGFQPGIPQGEEA